MLEVEFKCIYVCEDMFKCICLYNVFDEEVVCCVCKVVDILIDGIEKF